MASQGKHRAKTVSYRAKVFRNGGSQAVRLPRACQVTGEEVLVHRDGSRLVLEPVDLGWSGRFLAMFVGPPEPTLPDREQPRQRPREKLGR